MYFASTLDQAFWQSGHPEAGRLLAQAVNWTAAREPKVTVNSSHLVAARVRQHTKKDITAIHLTNYATNQIFLAGFPGIFVQKPQDVGRRQKVHHVSPECGIRITMQVAKDSSYDCYSFTGQKLCHERRNDQLVITIPVIHEGEIVIVENRKR